MKDNSLRRSKYTSVNRNFNLKNFLLKKEKINKNFLKTIKSLSLEEIVCLKLISSSEEINGKLYNFPFFKYSSDIVKEACVNFALSHSTSKREASMILGIPKAELNRLIKLYKINFEN